MVDILINNTMRPTTPQEFANCYGTFIADLVNVAYVLPQANTWLRTTLPDVESVYKLNVALFSAYKATVFLKRPPVRPRNREMGTEKQYIINATAYNKSVTLAWTAMTIDLKNALTCAGVDPTLAAKILSSFAKLKPAAIATK